MPQICDMDRRLYFLSEGRRVEDFFRPKNPTASAGCELANLGTKGQHATSRPPKPPTECEPANLGIKGQHATSRPPKPLYDGVTKQ
jgi:hypothetical protein